MISSGVNVLPRYLLVTWLNEAKISSLVEVRVPSISNITPLRLTIYFSGILNNAIVPSMLDVRKTLPPNLL